MPAPAASRRRTTTRPRRTTRRPPERGRRSRARLGRPFEAVLEQPLAVVTRPGLLQRMGLRQHQAIGLALLLLLTAMICLSFVSNAFYVWEPQIEGLQALSTEEVLRMAGIEGYHIFYVDAMRVAKAVAAMPAVERARVVCQLPNRVWLQVTERTPAVIWQSEGVQFWADREGALFERRGDLAEPTVIVEQGAGPRRAGQTVDARVVETVLGLRGWLPDMRIFGYSAKEGISFQLPDGAVVFVSVECKQDEVRPALERLQGELAAQGRQVNVIDLRYGGRAYLR